LSVARRLLESTELPVGEVATHVGFATRSALLRQIRRTTGLSPLQVRSAITSSVGRPALSRPA
jgi:AraC-like DNA-binding protein